MSFLQPFLLIALPLVAVPVIIHLINQRRYQTVNWAAMMFLLAANRMSRGYARLRQWLILAARMAAIAAIVFAVSRPLASGWVGLAAGGRPDTTIILLDRSPSMQESAVGSPASKLETGVQQLVQTLSTLGSTHWILIDSVSCKPTELESARGLVDSASAGPASQSADFPAMLQAAYDYIQANRVGRTEVWICSDQRAADWNAESARWQSLRDAFAGIKQGVRFHFLSRPKVTPGNLSVRVAGVRRVPTAEGAELLVSLHLAHEGDETKTEVPVHFEIDGARSEMTVEMTGTGFDLKDHPIPLTKDQTRGWGRVSIPADVNPADNEFYFAYSEPPPQQTILVADDPQAVHALELATGTANDPTAQSKAEIVSPADLAGVEWDKVALVVWQSALPEGEAAELVRSFVNRGGVIVFFPPANFSETEYYGVKWTEWQTPQDEVSVETWRGDQDLLTHTQSGAALPVGDLHIRRYCQFAGEATPLASLHGGAPLLARVNTDRGGIYFCTTTTVPGDSSLATDGVVLYVAMQRALMNGTLALGNTRQVVAGETTADAATPWKRIAGAEKALSTEYPAQAGVYSVGEQTLAVNRSAAEDQSAVLESSRLKDELFKGLQFDLVEAQAGAAGSLAQEIWRMFVIAMMGAMIVEAVLCLPKKRRPGAGWLWEKAGARIPAFLRKPSANVDATNGEAISEYKSNGDGQSGVMNTLEKTRPSHPFAPPAHKDATGGRP